MACIKECDICKKTYQPYGNRKDKENPNGFSWLNIMDCCCGTKPGYYVHNPMDTCIECRDKILGFIEELKEEALEPPVEELPEPPTDTENEEGTDES